MWIFGAGRSRTCDPNLTLHRSRQKGFRRSGGSAAIGVGVSALLASSDRRLLGRGAEQRSLIGPIQRDFGRSQHLSTEVTGLRSFHNRSYQVWR